MFSIAQLKHFQLAVREGSFTRAAELSNVSQSALSNSIGGLESVLGFKLFDRSARPFVLTPLGQSFLYRVEKLLFEMRNLEREATNLQAGATGTVRVGMSAITSSSLGGQIVSSWHQMFPKLHVDLVVQPTWRLIAQLENEELDFFMGDARDLQKTEHDFECMSLPSQRGGAFCRRGHPLSYLLKPDAADFLKYRFIGTHFPNDVKQLFYDLLGVSSSLPEPLIVLDCQNIATLRDAACASDLILLTTIGCVRKELAAGELVELPLGLNIRGYWSIARHKNRVTHPAVSEMIESAHNIAKLLEGSATPDDQVVS